MARYTGPTTKKSRSFGESIFGYDKSFDKRKYAPGQHGQSRKKKSLSEYGVQLKEKQKANAEVAAIVALRCWMDKQKIVHAVENRSTSWKRRLAK